MNRSPEDWAAENLEDIPLDEPTSRERGKPNDAVRDFAERVGPGVGAGKPQRFKLTPFDQIKMNTASDCVIEGLIPKGGFVVVWGPPKCGKSFVAFDWMMHVALGLTYRGLYVEQGAVVYSALEGGGGFGKRKEAWARRHADDFNGRPPPFFLLNVPVALVADQGDLIVAIEAQAPKPSVVVIDTLNRALGDLSENDGGDMGKLIKAVDAIRHRFGCAVVIIHHCGVDGARPRGHTALLGAYDALIAVEKNQSGLIKITVEALRDDEPIAPFYCRLENVELGLNDRGAGLHSCIVVQADHTGAQGPQGKTQAKVNANQQRFLDILAEAIYDAPDAHKTQANIPGNRIAITRMWLKMCCHTKGWLDKETSDNKQRSKLSEMINTLAGKRLIGATDRYVWDARI